MYRKVKRTLTVVTLLGVLGLGIGRPAPALADGTETALIVVGSIAGYAAIVVVGTLLVYGHGLTPAGPISADWNRLDTRQHSRLRLADRCPQGGPTFTLACW